MAKIALARVNLADSATVTAGSEVSALPAENVQRTLLYQVWRSSAEPDHLLFDFGASVSLDCVVLLGINLTTSATVRVRLSTADATGAAGDAYDSTAISAGLDPDFLSFVHVIASPVSGRYLRIDLADATLDYVEVGRVIAVRLVRLGHNFAFGYETFIDDPSTAELTEGGDEWVEERVARRGIRFRLPAVTDSEFRAEIEAINRLSAQKKDILAILDPEDENLPLVTYWGRRRNNPSAAFVKGRWWSSDFEIISR